MRNGDFVLYKNVFGGNKTIQDETLEAIVPFEQKANSRPFGLPVTPKVWWYGVGLNTFKEKQQRQKLSQNHRKLSYAKSESLKKKKDLTKIQKLEKRQERLELNMTTRNTWFWRNIGEKRVVVNLDGLEKTRQKIQKYFYDSGFRDASVELQIQRSPKRNIVRYLIHENDPYLIDSVIYIVKDSTLKEFILNHLQDSQLKAGQRLDRVLGEQEKNRLEYIVRNEGYFLFSKNLVRVYASNDTGREEDFFKEKTGHLIFEFENNASQNAFQKFYYSDVIFKTFGSNDLNQTQKDTLLTKGIRFLGFDKRIPYSPIAKRAITRAGDVYSHKAIVETQRQIALLNQFGFASSQIRPLSSNQLALEYFSPLLEKYTFSISPGVNNIYNNGYSFFGFGLPFSLIARNLFGQLDITEASIKVSYEGQPTSVEVNQNPIRGSLEIGLNLGLTLPHIYPFSNKFNTLTLKNPRTIFNLGYTYSEPFWGVRQNFRLSNNHAIQLSPFKNFYLALIDINLVNTIYSRNSPGQAFYQSLLDLQNDGNNLKVTYDPQFVSSVNANWVYSDQVLGQNFKKSRFFRLFVEVGGILLNLSKNKEQIRWVEKLFPLNVRQNSLDTVRTYFRFVKVNVDFRKNIPVSKSSSYSFRVNLGAANPYGSNRSLPYDKNFFIGGSNSVRAWAPRTLGTGAGSPDTTSVGNVIPQNGDIILEGSLEYRKKIYNSIWQWAAFVDAGNIWKWYKVETSKEIEKTNFELKRFYREIALGAGLGLRMDWTYFLLRLDFGVKVYDPARNRADRFVLDDFSFKRKRNYGLNLNFGIGYPF